MQRLGSASICTGEALDGLPRDVQLSVAYRILGSYLKLQVLAVVGLGIQVDSLAGRDGQRKRHAQSVSRGLNPTEKDPETIAQILG